ncbi:Panacea domain-containing protein, partial [Columbia Basin potato purple top phytoplasma]
QNNKITKNQLKKEKIMNNQNNEITIFDVANYIIKKNKSAITNMKLQKLTYYTYAKYLVENNQPIFNEPIEAWLHGPVFPNLYNEFKHYTYKPICRGAKKGEEKHLTNDHRVLIDRIIELYGNKAATSLSNLTHQEAPWRSAWDNNEDWSKNVIKDEIIKNYFTKNFKKIGRTLL